MDAQSNQVWIKCRCGKKSKQQEIVQMTDSSDIAKWAEVLRDITAEGLRYSEVFYDRDRYSRLQSLAQEMMTAAIGTTTGELTPLQKELFDHPGPFVGADAAIFDDRDRILLIRRSDNGLWALPGGASQVGERPSDTAVREALEESGIASRPVGLIGIYDSYLWGSTSPNNVYMISVLCEPTAGTDIEELPSHAIEVSERAWFSFEDLPGDLDPRHDGRIQHAFEFRNGGMPAYFDK
jgi:ADP-ribose pyrophosphatase YjhB (NUDIX family)